MGKIGNHLVSLCENVESNLKPAGIYLLKVNIKNMKYVQN